MTQDLPPGARRFPATARNQDPILAVLREEMPESGTVVEVAAGTGQHAAAFAAAFPALTWIPSEPDADLRASIAAWRAHANRPNLAAPVALDLTGDDPWPATPCAAIYACNLLHISPWTVTEALMARAGETLSTDGPLVIYGPFLEGAATAPSNHTFDRDLRARDPAWGVRPLADVEAEARRHGLTLRRRVEMPANNRLLVFRCHSRW